MFSPHVFTNVVVHGAERCPRLHRGLLNHLKAVLLLERAPRDVTLGLVLVSTADMRGISYQGGGADSPTDVLTFTEVTDGTTPLMRELFFGGEEGDNDNNDGHGPSGLSAALREEATDLGTIYVCLPYMWHRCRARPTRNLPFAQYLLAALVHAELHALGYDHETPEQLRRMARREQQLGRQLRALARRHPSLLPPPDALEYLRSAPAPSPFSQKGHRAIV